MRPETKIEKEIGNILSRYSKLSKLGDEAEAMNEIAHFVMQKVLELEQVGLKGVDEWAIDFERIKQLEKDLFTV